MPSEIKQASFMYHYISSNLSAAMTKRTRLRIRQAVGYRGIPATNSEVIPCSPVQSPRALVCKRQLACSSTKGFTFKRSAMRLRSPSALVCEQKGFAGL